MTERAWQVNGRPLRVRFDDGARLVDVLRAQGLTGTKEGCGEGECGACSVLVDGTLVVSCLALAAAQPDGARILTVEGLEDDPVGARIIDAFEDLHAVQCGYCTPGMLMAARALLGRDPHPDRAQVALAMSGNICRCTGYAAIVDAVLVAAGGEGG